MSPFRCLVQWSRPMFVSGYCISAALEEDTCELHISPGGYPMQWRRPALVLNCCVDAMIEKDACEFYMSPIRRQMQGGPPILGLGFCISAALEKGASGFYMTIRCCPMQWRRDVVEARTVYVLWPLSDQELENGW